MKNVQTKPTPKIVPLTVPELKTIVGSGPGGLSGVPDSNSCICVCAKPSV
jgi:hypothetical protein